MTERAGLEHILARIDPASMRGIEIGPLHNPVIARAPGVEVFYVDHADTETLRAKYADDPNVPEVLPVDFAWGDRRLADAVGDAAPFDYAIASHVIEHVPDLVAWFNELGDVLEPGGVLSLVIPDKRYCFDIRRDATEPAEIVAAHLEARRRPTLAQIYDFWSKRVEVDTLAVWAGRPGFEPEPPNDEEAFSRCQGALGHDDYIDVHATTWTPTSFVDVMATLFRLDLVPYRFAAFQPTPFNSLKFYASLERLPDDLPAHERRQQQLDSLPTTTEVALPFPPADGNNDNDNGAGPPAGVQVVTVSDREARLIEAKRRVFTRLRGLARR